ncbi:MAG: HEAT repeat domain-containing protein [Candidatus Heimdallarchaeum aukensis]|uniref:HEAT repeat domain-containing protein n=1 Tax=Candidatus Heimdallarchaeum aukensis TaxID=2876573 RepID=A0A9Y1BL02_9ARCH|nr:MAG: HEAT repeat domain-containing protein [Candidatus Heimdallarchaeum aukensis]UJG40984.1 MAG: HEAT repeat domain-containing protein [Candidatus Heimdallarchaeum aukensis]
MVSIKKVLKQLEDSDPIVRRDAILTLGELKDEKGVDPLIKCVQQEIKENRITAIVALSDIGDHRAIEILIYCLMDDDEEIRLAAARALGRFTSPQAITTLLVSLKKDPSVRVKSRAALSLGSIGSELPVEELLKESKLEHPTTLLYSINSALTMIAKKNGYSSVDELVQKIRAKKAEVDEKTPEHKQIQEKEELESFPRLYDYIRKYVARELEGVQTVLSINSDEKTASKKIADILAEKFWKFAEWIGKRMGHKLTEYQSDLLWQMIWDTSRPIRNEIYQMIRDHRSELEELNRFQKWLNKIEEQKEEEIVKDIERSRPKPIIQTSNNVKKDEAETIRAADLARSISSNLEEIMGKYSSWKTRELKDEEDY